MGCAMQPCFRSRMGVQTEGKIDGGRRRSRASGDRLFFVKCAEGKALSNARGIEAERPRQVQAGSVHESPSRRARQYIDLLLWSVEIDACDVVGIEIE